MDSSACVVFKDRSFSCKPGRTDIRMKLAPASCKDMQSLKLNIKLLNVPIYSIFPAVHNGLAVVDLSATYLHESGEDGHRIGVLLGGGEGEPQRCQGVVP